MTLKVSNETKVGALTIISIVVLVLGFYYLKGKSLFKTGTYIHAIFHDVNGLVISDAVIINGLRVGAVYNMQEANKSVDNIEVTIKLEKKIDIPTNSIAIIQSNPLGSSSIEIKKGDSKTYIKADDTLKTAANTGGLLSVFSEKLDPITQQAQIVLGSIDSLVKNVNTIISTGTKNDFRESIANIRSMTGNLVASSATFNSILTNQHNNLNQTVQNLSAFAKNLSDNNSKISNTLSNVEKASGELAKISVQKTIEQLNNTVTQLDNIVSKINNGQGSLGQLINDKKLYTNLTATMYSLNTLLDDLRLHPKRYVQFSVFGKKDKSAPLMRPLEDSLQSQK